MYDFTTLRIINQYRNSYTNKPNWVFNENPESITLDNGITFNDSNIESVEIKEYNPVAKENIVIDFSKLGDTVSSISTVNGKSVYVGVQTPVKAISTNQHVFYRICLKVKLEHYISPIYSDRAANKGIPIYIEFEVFPNDTSKEICARIIKNIKDNNLNFVIKDKEKNYKDSEILNFIGNGKLIEVSSNDYNNLVLTAISNAQRFEDCCIEEFREDLKIKKFVPIFKKNVITKNKGSLGFGTYEQLINEVRLMSGENLVYKALYSDELPLKKGKYSQYIITIKSPLRDKGISSIGEKSRSLTKHVLWINEFTEDTKQLTDFKQFLNKYIK